MPHGRRADESAAMEGKFWLGMFGVIVGVCVAGALVFLFLGYAWYTWGPIAAIVAVMVVVVLIASLVDRRRKRELAEEMAEDY
jgi:bacteriorhodopsin